LLPLLAQGLFFRKIGRSNLLLACPVNWQTGKSFCVEEPKENEPALLIEKLADQTVAALCDKIGN